MTTRTNLCTNPSFENNTNDWSRGGTPSTIPIIAQSAALAVVGTKSLLVTWKGGAGYVTLPPFTAVIGQTYTISAYVYVPSGGGGGHAVHLSLDGVSGANSVTFDAWERVYVTATASSTTEFPTFQGGNTGQTVYVDAVMVELAPLAASYFDGSSVNGSWTGTAGNSTSIVTPPVGVGSVTVANDLTNLPPRQVIFVTNSPGTTITINRTDPDGTIRAVRTAEAGVLVGGQWSGYDYESPFDPAGGHTVTYTVSPSDASTPYSASAPALVVTQSWLIHPGIPSLSQPLYRITVSDFVTESGATLHIVLGRTSPIPVTDGRRKSETFTLTVRTSDATSTDAFEAILADTSVLLLQMVYPFTVAALYYWLSIGQVTEARVSMQFGDNRRIFTMNCTAVDRPAGGIVSQRSWADLMADAATWSATTIRFATWNGALTGVAGT